MSFQDEGDDTILDGAVLGAVEALIFGEDILVGAGVGAVVDLLDIFE